MIIHILKILLAILFTPKNNQPVRLNKQQQELEIKKEIIIVGLAITIILVCLLLLFVTSCTDSGLVYNNEFA